MMPTAGPSGQGPTNPQVSLPSLGGGVNLNMNMIPGVPVGRNHGADYNNPDSIPKPWGEQAPTIPAIPTQQSSAAIAAAHAAAAAAAVAAGSAPNMSNMPNMSAPGATNQGYSNGFVPQHNNPNFSANVNVNGHGNGIVNAEEDGAIRAAQMKRRKQLLDECVDRNRATYRHPKGSQEETIIFHRARALLDITNLSQTFICQRTTITNAALSQYLRCCFKGRQDTLEDKLEVFIIEYLEGKYDGDARKQPTGRRKSSSDAYGGPSRRYSNNNNSNINMKINRNININGNPVNNMSQMSPANGATHAGILSYQHRMAQQHLLQQQQQHALMRQHQPQHQHQYAAAAAAAAAAGARGQYNHGGAAGHYSNQRVARVAGQGYNNRQYPQQYTQQQQYALQQQLLRQQHYQQQQAYQNQLALQYRRTQVAAANAAAAAQAAAPQLKPLPPTVAVEKAFHAYQSANLDITSTNAEPLLVSIEINVQLEDGEGVESADVQEVSEDTLNKDTDSQTAKTGTEANVAEGNGKDAEKSNGDSAPDSDSLDDDVDADRSNSEAKVAGENRKKAKDTSTGQESAEAERIENGDKAMNVEPNSSVGREIVEDVLKFVEKEKKSSEGSDSSKLKDGDKEGGKNQGNGRMETLEKKNSTDDTQNNGNSEDQEEEDTGSDGGEGKVDGKSKEAKSTGDDDVEMEGDAKEIDGDGDVNMEEKDAEGAVKDGSTSPSKRVRTGSVTPPASGDPSAANGATNKEGEGNAGGSESSAEVPAKPLLRELRYLTQWDVNERRLSPEEVASSIIKAHNCHPALASKVAFAIRRHLFEVGVSCAVPPCEREKENLRRICIRVSIKGDEGTEEGVIEDSFDWDICMGEYNSAELFAQHICSDNGVSQYHVPQVAQAIRKQVMLAQAVSYGDKETADKARKIIVYTTDADNDNSRKPSLAEKLEPRKHGVRRLTEAEKRELREQSVHALIMEPLFENISDEIDKREWANLQKRIAAAKHEEEERVRKEIEKKKNRELDAENSKLKKKIMGDADKWATELGTRLDPYLEFKLGKGKVPPSIWVEGMVLRKKAGAKIMPAISDEEMQKLAEKVPKKRKGVKGKGTGRGRGRPRKNPLPPPPEDGAEGNAPKETPKKVERKRRSSTRNGGSASKRARK